MTVEVTLIGQDISFKASSSESLLASALVANVNLRHSCKNGQCGECKATLVRGEVEFSDQYGVLNHSERQHGVILSCTAFPISDIEIDAEYIPELASINKKTVPCKVASIEHAGTDVAIVRLRLPPAADFIFLPGQYVDVSFQGITRSYSLACRQLENNQLELHIRNVPGGQFSQIVFGQLKLDQLLRINGPHGSFFVRNENRPLIFLAGGTGFAPVKAMVEDLLSRGDRRPIHVYWGQRTAASVYSDLIIQWASLSDHIRTHLVISDDDSWTGRQGLVHEAVLEDIPTLGEYAVYACGSPGMIAAAKTEFVKHGLDAKAFHSDAFLSAVPVQEQKG